MELKSNKRMYKGLVFGLVSVLLVQCDFRPDAAVVIENAHFRYTIGEDGENLHFIDKRDGKDYLNQDSVSYCAYIRKGDRQYRVDEVRGEDGRIYLSFADSGVEVQLQVREGGENIVLEVASVQGEVESLNFLNVPLALHGMPDEVFSACVLALNPFTHVRQLPALQSHLWARAYDRFGLEGASVAVLGLPTAEMLPAIRSTMTDADAIPASTAGGAWAQQSREGYGSYLMNFGSLTEQTVDTWIDMCKRLGFNQIDNHGGGFFNFGELKIDRERFPGGWADFKKINDRLDKAGISSILHTYAYFIDKNSKYVTPVVHPDLGYFNAFTLAEPIDADDTVIVVKESTADVSTITGFFVRNSVSLRVGGELIEFTGVTDTPPYRFTGCRRGAHGTTVSAHPANEKAYHLKEVYGRLIADPESALFKEIARRTAEVVNAGDFDGIYLDAVDGGDVLAGGENFWYYPSQFIFEIAKHLKKPVGMEMASMAHFWWHYRSRWQAWDSPQRGYKRFIDIHLAAIKSPNLFLTPELKHNDFEHGVWRGDTALINKYAPLENGSLLLPLSLGWWSNNIGQPPQTETTFTDDIEYLGCKMIGNNAGLAMTGGFDLGTINANPLYQKLVALIRQYETLRQQHYFGDSIRALLRVPGKEFKLFQHADGHWDLKHAAYQKHKVSASDETSLRWNVHNTFGEQPIKLRIEALMAANAHGDQKPVVIADVATAGFTQADTAPGVSGGLEKSDEQTPDGSPAWEFVANRTGESPRTASWINMEKRFDPILNIAENQALGVWVKGDGNGELLNLRLESPKHISHGGRGDHFIHINFTGWKYFELVEIESSAFSNFRWPMSDLYVYDSYRHSIDFKNINKLQLWYNNLPEGKTVTCKIGPITALPMVRQVIENPTLTIDGKKMVIPVKMESGMYLEYLAPDDCELYSANGTLLQTVSVTGEVPVLAAGDNEISFTCEGQKGVHPRAQVTVISYGEPLVGEQAALK